MKHAHVHDQARATRRGTRAVFTAIAIAFCVLVATPAGAAHAGGASGGMLRQGGGPAVVGVEVAKSKPGATGEGVAGAAAAPGSRASGTAGAKPGIASGSN